METVKISLPIARNAMRLVHVGAMTEAAVTLGITQADFDLVVGDKPWTGRDRGRVRGVLDALTHGVVDVLALPRIRVPAEFRAAVLISFVHPVNMMLAACWSETDPSAVELADGGVLDAVSGEQLYALCTLLVGDRPEGQPRFEKRTKKAVVEAEKEK